jgi:cytochrome P450
MPRTPLRLPRRRWLGPLRVLLRTRSARRDQDAGAALRALSRGADRSVGLRLRGRRAVLLLTPDLVTEVLVDAAPQTVKGPGVQLTRRLLGDGLLTSEGADHQRARRLVAPVFSPQRLAGYATAIGEVAAQVAWEDDSVVDVSAALSALTLTAVGHALLGVDLAAEAPAVRTALDSALEQFGGAGLALPGTAEPPPLVGVEPLHALVDRVIALRTAAPGADVVSALVAACDASGGLTGAQVHDHVMTLLMAGHETTANALTWTLHLLSQHPEAQERVREEVDRLERAPSYAELAGLVLTRAVVTEAMRLFPPAWIVGRTTTAPLIVDGRDLPTGTVLVVSPLLLHHDPRWFPEPEAFDPDRWLDARRAAVPRHAYLPFGTGPRSCLGEQFAWVEAVTLLAVLVRRFRFAALSSAPPVPQYRVTLRPEGGLPLRVHQR